MSKPQIIHPQMTKNERLACQYFFLGFKPVEIAKFMKITYKAVAAHLLRSAKKYGDANGTNYCPRQMQPFLKDRDKQELLFLDTDFEEDEEI